MVTSPILECIIVIDILSKRPNFHIGSPNYGMRVIMVGKTKWKSLELSLPRKKVNQKQCSIHGGVAGIAISQDLKDAMS